MVAIYTCDRHQQHAEDWLINKINEEPQSEVINEPKDSRND